MVRCRKLLKKTNSDPVVQARRNGSFSEKISRDSLEQNKDRVVMKMLIKIPFPYSASLLVAKFGSVFDYFRVLI
jgi:hypothetical protein